jgi:hypothetical protein
MATWNHMLSVHTYRRTRSHPIVVADYLHVPIEPTAAFLRDPRKCWAPLKETYTQSKDYLVPLSLNAAACPAIQDPLHGGACNEAGALHRQATRRSQVWLFDAGATLPSVTTQKNDWSGTGFLFQWYQRRGLVFDHVYAWEPKSKATVSFKAVPQELMPALHFYPDPVNPKVRRDVDRVRRGRKKVTGWGNLRRNTPTEMDGETNHTFECTRGTHCGQFNAHTCAHLPPRFCAFANV